MSQYLLNKLTKAFIQKEMRENKIEMKMRKRDEKNTCITSQYIEIFNSN